MRHITGSLDGKNTIIDHFALIGKESTIFCLNLLGYSTRPFYQPWH